MSKLSAELERAFEAAELRPTSQRYAVLEFLAKHPVHATAEEIFVALNRHDPRASRATVYNNLRSLEMAGLVREVLSEGKAARYDANLHRHHHFVCEKCGMVEDISQCNVEKIEKDLQKTKGLLIRHHSLEFFGLCAKCQQ